MLAEAVADRDFFEGESLTQQVKGENLSVVVVVDDLRSSSSLPREGPHPRLSIRNVVPCEEHEKRSEGVVADLSVQPHPSHSTQEAASEHIVRPSIQDRYHEAGYVLWVVFEIRVEIGDDVGTVLDRGTQTCTHCGAEALVQRVPDHSGTLLPRYLCGPVSRAVVHHCDTQLPARNPYAGDAVQKFPNGGLFIIGWDDDSE